MVEEKRELPSWYGKQIEDMTSEEKKEYEAYLERFVWKEGDLQYVGHKPLTKEQVALVKRLKAEENKDKNE